MAKKTLILSASQILAGSEDCEIEYFQHTTQGDSAWERIQSCVEKFTGMRDLLKSGDFGLVVVEAIWDRKIRGVELGQPASWLRRQVKFTYWWFFVRFLTRQIRRAGLDFVVHDQGDDYTISPINRHLLEKCALYFKRELAVERWRSLESLDRLRMQSVLRRSTAWMQTQAAKLRPVSLGLSVAEERVTAVEMPLRRWEDREWDCLVALGAVEHKPLREKLKELFASESPPAGLRVRVVDAPLDHEDFLAALNNSKSCLSPSGYGWDCYRHYEALYFGALPMINYPDIERRNGMVHGETCYYFDPCADLQTELWRVLGEVGEREGIEVEQLRQFVLNHHSRKAHLRWILEAYENREGAAKGDSGRA